MKIDWVDSAWLHETWMLELLGASLSSPSNSLEWWTSFSLWNLTIKTHRPYRITLPHQNVLNASRSECAVVIWWLSQMFCIGGMCWGTLTDERWWRWHKLVSDRPNGAVSWRSCCSCLGVSELTPCMWGRRVEVEIWGMTSHSVFRRVAQVGFGLTARGPRCSLKPSILAMVTLKYVEIRWTQLWNWWLISGSKSITSTSLQTFQERERVFLSVPRASACLVCMKFQSTHLDNILPFLVDKIWIRQFLHWHTFEAATSLRVWWLQWHWWKAIGKPLQYQALRHTFPNL